MDRWGQSSIWNSQSVGGSQDEGHRNSAGPLESGGLDGESRSEGCLLHHSNSSSPPTVFEVHSGWTLLPVHVWPFMCPMDLHQINETSDVPVEGLGNQDNNIYIWCHAVFGEVQGHSSAASRGVIISPGKFVVNKKLHLHPAHELEFLGHMANSEEFPTHNCPVEKCLIHKDVCQLHWEESVSA